ncbi:GNAT family N-acetyltransferase [Microbacterium testaceum]|uniref:GNAT family N-acetyltransferase n=1 Tax=Microbacterium testaceum TaxID=2033 RepID=UPI00187BFFAE|nr:GNAT family N-acetyltransferase [Microbacterium testaceum]
MHSLRPRTNADLPVVASWVPNAEALYAFAGPWMTWPFLPEELDDLHRRPGATAWMLDTSDGEPVGHVQLTPVDDALRIGRLIVAPSVRGEGRGRRLLRLALDHAGARGVSRVQLGVLASNTPARRLYESLGFVADPETLDAPMMLMARDI